MREGFVGVLSTVAAGTGLTNAAEGEAVETGVEHDVVDGSAAGTGVGEKVFFLRFVVSEDVETEGGITDLAGDFNKLFLGGVGDDVVRKDGTEDFFRKEGVVEGIDFDNGGLDPVALGIRFTADDDFTLGVVKERLNTVKVAGVDDIAAVDGVVSAVRKELFDRFFAGFDPGCFLGGVDEDVVGGDTDLTAVVKFGPEGTRGGEFAIAVLGDNDRIETAADSDVSFMVIIVKCSTYSSKRQGVKCFAAAALTIFATLPEPVYMILSHFFSNNALV